MFTVLRRNATPLTAVLFLASFGTGLLILPVSLHLWRNWRGMLGYWRRLF